jgi:hypothetical protein
MKRGVLVPVNGDRRSIFVDSGQRSLTLSGHSYHNPFPPAAATIASPAFPTITGTSISLYEVNALYPGAGVSVAWSERVRSAPGNYRNEHNQGFTEANADLGTLPFSRTGPGLGSVPSFWIVCEVQDRDLLELDGGRCMFRTGVVKAEGNFSTAKTYAQTKYPA